MRQQRGFRPQLSIGLLLLAYPLGVVGQTARCGPEDLGASLPSNDQAYPDAIALSETLSTYGISVKCILTSTMNFTFDGQNGAATYRTDHGNFEVLFLPQPKTFDRLKVIERRHGERYSYRFKGPPQPWPANLIESVALLVVEPLPAELVLQPKTAFRIYFIKNRNVLFVVEVNKELAATLGKLVRSEPNW
jgi:hypothetical protein